MEFIKESPEHHFLVLAEQIKAEKTQWRAVRVNYTHIIQHEKILKNPILIKKIMAESAQQSQSVLKQIMSAAEAIESLTLYQFLDGDLVFILQSRDEAERSGFKTLYQKIQECAGLDICQYYDLAKGDYGFQKLVEEKFVVTERIKAYLAMADVNKIRSISVRRDKREEPVVMIVEDDAFTAEYAQNILKDDYKTVLASSGEEAIVAYIDHAPDIVFMDIHLPGLDGKDTLSTIMKIDPRAHVMMLSVDAVKENIIKSRKTGAAGFIKKPFSSDRLLHAVCQSPYVRTVVPPSDPVPDDMVNAIH